MELFKDSNIDFLGKKPLTLGLSIALVLGSLLSLALKGGPKYGIDFRGGTLVTVKFKDQPPVEEIRAALASKGVGEVTVQEFTGQREVIIGTEMDDERSLDQARRTIEATLAERFGKTGGKLDLNNAGAAALAGRLREPLNRAGAGVTEDQLQKLATAITDYRDKQKSGLLDSVDELSRVPGVTPAVVNALRQETAVSNFNIRQVEIVGPKAGGDLQRQAVMATLYALAGMLVYIAIRFEFIAGVAAVVAIIHDTLITLGFLSVFNQEVNLNVVAALLTLIGYSMNDKIVVFDRVRENLKASRREPLHSLVNRSINQTLSRTLLTAGPTLLTAFALYFLGGPVLESIALALIIGIVVGTYSSIFVASAILVWWNERKERQKRPVTVAAAAGPAPVRTVPPQQRTPAKSVK